jgi:putative transposase
MFQISRKTPAYFFTSVAHHRLPIFRTDKLKQVLCAAFHEARINHKLLIFAYVIMPDHIHMLVASEKSMSETLRLINGVSARRVIQFLKENGHQSSLLKLRGETRERNHRHSVWHHHSDSLEVFGEDTFRQKAEYIHQNPVRAELADDRFAYEFSSARAWSGKETSDEPLSVDQRQIAWRTGGGAAIGS